MSRFAIRIGLALVVVSIVYTVLSPTKSYTSWIPALLGVLIALLGWLAARGGPFAIGAIRLVALAGFAACLWQLWKGGFELSKYPPQAQAITAVLCGLLVVRSLIATPAAPPPDPDWRRNPPH